MKHAYKAKFPISEAKKKDLVSMCHSGIIPTEFHATQMKHAYKAKFPISEAKKKDLVSMCHSGIIPTEFHSYYENILSSKSAKDDLPESDADGLDE